MKMNEQTKPWQNASILKGAILGLLPLIPGVNSWVQGHQELVLPLFGILGMFLGHQSKQ